MSVTLKVTQGHWWCRWAICHFSGLCQVECKTLQSVSSTNL